MIAIERTPAGPQYVLPGSERREAGRAQRAADKPLTGRVPQLCFRMTPGNPTCST